MLKSLRDRIAERSRIAGLEDRLKKLEAERRDLQYRFDYLLNISSESRNVDALNKRMADIQYEKKIIIHQLKGDSNVKTA